MVRPDGAKRFAGMHLLGHTPVSNYVVYHMCVLRAADMRLNWKGTAFALHSIHPGMQHSSAWQYR